MRLLKPLLETCSEEELTLLAQQYDGFYHFMQLLERLAEAIQDGVIDVPQDVPIPPDWPEKPQRPRKKRPRKPKPKHSQKPQQKQIRRPITFLPALSEVIIGSSAQTEEQYQLFSEARSKPHVLDDATIDQAVQAYEEQLTYLPLHEKQLKWWLADDLSQAQRYQVEDLLTKLPLLREKTEALLTLLTELRRGTINRIMEMNDEELGAI
jgi:hypothetical protein